MRKLVLALLSMVMVLGCSLYKAQHLANQCPGSGKSTQPPIVCINPTTLQPSQDPVYVHSGQFAHFFITGGKGNLTITYEPGTPVDNAGHQGDHAWVHAKQVSAPEKYKYTIDIDGRKRDPEMIIQP